MLLALEPAQHTTAASNSSLKDINTEQEQPASADVSGSTCCWSKILSPQSDFVNERPLLQTIIKDAGHICLFLPKFHCNLNPIKLFWSYIKEFKLIHNYTFPSLCKS
jgi:hypothetical protein